MLHSKLHDIQPPILIVQALQTLDKKFNNISYTITGTLPKHYTMFQIQRANANTTKLLELLNNIKHEIQDYLLESNIKNIKHKNQLLQIVKHLNTMILLLSKRITLSFYNKKLHKNNDTQ